MANGEDRGLLRSIGEGALAGFTGTVAPAQAPALGVQPFTPLNQVDAIVRERDALNRIAEKLVPEGSPDAGETTFEQLMQIQGRTIPESARPLASKLRVRKEYDTEFKKAQIKETEADIKLKGTREQNVRLMSMPQSDRDAFIKLYNDLPDWMPSEQREETARNALGAAKGQKPKQPQAVAEDEMVAVINPSGVRGKIKKSKLKEKLSQGYKQVK